ncbi:MAG TPA: TolC family protein, partial [Flavobacteriaceae bacterium]|nr:TolC family protein [Flavobacteriaceae bacterium]
MKQGLLSVLLIFGIGLSVSAQISENTSLTNLYKNAASYPGLKAKTAGIEAAKFNQTITKRKILPGIQFQAQNTYGSYEGTAGAFFPVGGIFNVSGDGPSSETAVNTFISATAQWDFIQFGKHRDEVKLAEIDKDKAETDFELADIDLKKEITAVYLSWQYANYMQDWAKREVERDSIILKLAQTRVNSGLASAADSLL